MRDTREKKLRAKHERIFTSMDPFSQSSPSRPEQEYPVSPKSLPSRRADHGAMVEKEVEEVEAETDSKRAHQNHKDDDRPWPVCQEPRSMAVADCSTAGASTSLVDLSKEDFEGEAVTASVIAGKLTIAGRDPLKERGTQMKREEGEERQMPT